jgi:hypothetical protein
MRDLFRRTKAMSHDVVQLLVLTLIPALCGLVMRRELPGAWRWDHRGRGPWFKDPAACALDGPFVGLLHQDGPMVRPCAGR